VGDLQCRTLVSRLAFHANRFWARLVKREDGKPLSKVIQS
jgi:hypothetical protein